MGVHGQDGTSLGAVEASGATSIDDPSVPVQPLPAVLQLVHRGHHDLVRLHRLLERAIRKERWAGLVAKKNAQLKSVMSAVKRALGGAYLRRENGPGRTRVFYARHAQGEEIVAVVVYCPNPKTLADFDTPIRIEVLDPSSLEMSMLEDRSDVELAS